ncbi:hypothetical protein MA16_Dca017037 [Dendrobium catenatum]|uniref:Uncharacterized protein n=1 Tax=Dendrobium catenatum TaxID=906689 RepID=A0A2I0V9G4_9ASPA|nr:hypothetical protein MA16_Dca017037 [Dendrobium catenatum]
MLVDDRRCSAGDCPREDRESSLMKTKTNNIIRQGQYKDFGNNSLSSNHNLVAGKWIIPESGLGSTSLNYLNCLQSCNSMQQGALLIKENSNPIQKTISFVEGKGKKIIQLDETETPKNLKLYISNHDTNASSSGMKIFVNRFVNSNAIPGPHHSNFIPSIAEIPALECYEKIILRDHNQIEIRNSGYAESNYDINTGNYAIVADIRQPEGNLEDEQNKSSPITHNNKFFLLNDLIEEGVVEELQTIQMVKDLEEGEILVNKDECQGNSEIDPIQGNIECKSVTDTIKSNSKGRLQSQKIKLAKEMKFLGPLSSSSRMTRNSSIKTKGGGISPFKSK